jgi:hypothetical protein
MRKIFGLSSAAHRTFRPAESTVRRAFLWIAFFALLPLYPVFSQNIPLPEHPRPDFHRAAWLNLNGTWGFAFDSLDVGVRDAWFEGKTAFAQRINVPFPWGSKLSGVADEADIAWYQRSVTIPSDWSGSRIFLVIGASDWETSAWVDGHKVGTHQGGYTPFSFELTPYVKAGQNSLVSIRVDDKRRDFTLYGKQGYGNARGIWQTTYLEARAATFLEYVHCTPDIERQEVSVELALDKVPQQDLPVQAEIKTPAGPLKTSFTYPKGARIATARIRLPEQRLWTLEDPYLYEMSVQVGEDRVDTYFGMRKISTAKLPGTDYTYVALNNKPLYLQLTLDQSYHPDGFYTFPSDEFMRNEIQLCKDIGLNGIRTHIKVDVPRKLYWADKLGMLVMSDLPNSWGQPDEAMQAESERTLREMIRRDYNHPSIFSWIVFNETWGLSSKVQNPENGKEESRYLPRTQHWVASMYYLAKSLDPTRLVEDNSICCGAGHTETDINSWHEYLPGWAWEERLKTIDEKTFIGSTYHFQPGFQQGDQPNINSECGNVWGYDGSTGDVDWSWDYHRMMNTFRKYPKVAGWLYTEHHDVINEWNGYWRFDRSPKFTGLEELAEGMSTRDFHSPFYISTGNDICVTVKGGERVSIPLYLSVMSDMPVPDNRLSLEITGTFMDKTGMEKTVHRSSRTLAYTPWMQASLPAETFLAPASSGLGRVQLLLKDPSSGEVLHHNVFHFVVDADANPDKVRVFEQPPAAFSAANWSLKQWQVLDGHKVNGAGKGFFEYRIPLASLNLAQVAEAYFLIEVSSKPLLDKDRDKSFSKDQDYMLGARVSPHQNPNAYPMTDVYPNPSELRVSIQGRASQAYRLADDPADHRGVLSWHSQPKDRKLYEAGTFGYLVRIPLSRAVLKTAQQQGYLQIRLEADNGLAVYGERFGRYPINPSVVVRMR